jgi:hypothetical protein
VQRISTTLENGMTTFQKPRYGTYAAFIRSKDHRTIVKTFKEHKLARQWARAIENKIEAGVFRDRKAAEETG